MRSLIAIRISVLISAMIVWTTSAWSQADLGLLGQQSAQQQHDLNSAKTPPSSFGLSQDTQFLALLRARDGQFAIVGELRRVISFHDNFRARLERYLNSYATSPNHDRASVDIKAALENLDKFERSVRATNDPAEKINLTKAFDDDFPVRVSERRVLRPRSSIDLDNDPRFFVQRERANANEIFQNFSIENREWLAKYDNLFNDIEIRLTSAVEAASLKGIDGLPAYFYELAGVDSFEELTPEQIQSSVDAYRNVLRGALGDLEDKSRLASTEIIRNELLIEFEQIGRDLLTRSSALNSEFGVLENSIARTTKSLYGNEVGSESFNYLLIVFAIVFGVIVIFPRFYSSDVAINILKAEFLLQFSTVFVLIAAIIILGIGKFIDSQDLSVLLAGISGYVLGQLGNSGSGITGTNNQASSSKQA